MALIQTEHVNKQENAEKMISRIHRLNILPLDKRKLSTSTEIHIEFSKRYGIFHILTLFIELFLQGSIDSQIR